MIITYILTNALVLRHVLLFTLFYGESDKKTVTILSHPWWYTEITARERPKPNNKKQFKEESIMTNTSQSLCAIR